MADGSIDTIVENWGHPDLVKKYIDEQGTVEDAGLTGNEGIIGWFVPPWMAEKYPDITDWKNLNKYADMFKTSESGGKGQLLDGDPSLRHQRRGAGQEPRPRTTRSWSAAARPRCIQSFRTAEKNKTPLLAYFYTPQWFAEVDEMRRLGQDPVRSPRALPYTEGCDADPAKVDCDYPPYHLNKLISTEFADSGSPAVRPGQELQVDQRGPEPGREATSPGRDDPGRRGPEVDRRQPGQGRRLAAVTTVT